MGSLVFRALKLLTSDHMKKVALETSNHSERSPLPLSHTRVNEHKTPSQKSDP